MKEFIRYDSDVEDFTHTVQFDREREPSMVSSIEKAFFQSMQVHGLKLEAVPNPALILCLPKNVYQPELQPIVTPSLVLNLSSLLGTFKKKSQLL